MLPEGNFQTWEEMQRLALPPNATMLVPPPEPIDSLELASNSPDHRTDWLDDGFYAEAAPTNRDRTDENPDDGPVRLLANLITLNAVLEYAHSPAREDRSPRQKPKNEPPVPEDD